MVSKAFYIDTVKEKPTRFDMSKFMLFESDHYNPITAQIFEKLLELKQDGEYKVEGFDSRPDMISYQIYEDTQYWWVLMVYNRLTSISEIKHGDIIKYPSLSSLEDLFYTLKTQQNKVDR